MEKKALGRGLEALIPTSKPAPMPELPEVQHLRINAIVPNRYQPRQTFSPQELSELTASLKQSGLLQPVLVRRKGDGMYELISGERRWRAAKEAGLETIQAIIRNCTDEESIVLALIENLQRQDLNPIDTARAYHRMMNEFGLTQDIIAQRVGCERSSIANAVRLLNLPVDVQHLIHDLKSSGCLAQKTGVDLGGITGKDHHQNTDQDDDIPGDDDDHQPAGDHFNDGKGDKSGGDEEFVSDGVEVSAQLGPLVGQACNEAVQAVCDPCYGKSDKGPFEVFIDDENDEEGNQEDSR